MKSPDAAITNNGLWPHDTEHVVDHDALDQLSIEQEDPSKSKLHLNCWPVAFDTGANSWRLITSIPCKTAYPAEGSPFCWMKVNVMGQELMKSSWWPCVRIKAPDTKFDLQSRDWTCFAAFQVVIPAEWTAKYEELDLPSSFAPTLIKAGTVSKPLLSLDEAAKIQIEVVNGRFPWRPILSFDNKSTFCEIHRYGINRELQIEESQIEKSNHGKRFFQCWFLASHQTDLNHNKQQWTMIVDARGASDLFPPMLERCEMGFMLPDVSYERDSDLYETITSIRKSHMYGFDAERRGCRWFWCNRVQNPAKEIHLQDRSFENYATFRVSLPFELSDENDFLSLLKPIFEPGVVPGRLRDTLTRHRFSRVCFWRKVSDTTTQVERFALDHAKSASSTSRIGQAVDYLMRFENPQFHENLFQTFPHLHEPGALSNPLPPRLKEAFLSLDEDQTRFYNELLGKVPCGVLMIPGPSGVGKTHFAMTLIAMLMGPYSTSTESQVTTKRQMRILLQSDTNRMADDLANFSREFLNKLGLTDIKIVRCRNWNHERPSSELSLGTHEQPSHKAQPLEGRKGDTLVESLNDLCTRRSKESPDEDGESDELMRRVLTDVDIIITTPTGAAKLAENLHGYWVPDVVIVDDAGRVKEASLLVSLTKFPDAKFWCFIGSDQQTRPFVQDSKDLNLQNLAGEQLRVSTLTRFVRSGIQKKSEPLLMAKHGVYGGLERLPSSLFFHSKLHVPEGRSDDHDHNSHVNKEFLAYLKNKVTQGRDLEIPRALVHIEGAGPPRTMPGGTSLYNVEHQVWVMSRVTELVECISPAFSIMIVTPYAESARQYRDAIRNLMKALDDSTTGDGRHGEILLEARTIDTAQGHAADIVFIDLVRQDHNKHIDDEHRLCVGLNLARRMEIIMMHSNMPKARGFHARSAKTGSSILSKVVDYCKKNSLIVNVPMAATGQKASMAMPIQQEPQRSNRDGRPRGWDHVDNGCNTHGRPRGRSMAGGRTTRVGNTAHGGNVSSGSGGARGGNRVRGGAHNFPRRGLASPPKSAADAGTERFHEQLRAEGFDNKHTGAPPTPRS